MAKGKDKKKGGAETVDRMIENRRARYDYQILDTLETGMVLRGSEVKSIRDGKVSLAEGYVRVEGPGLKGAGRASGRSGGAGGGAAAEKSGRGAVRRPGRPGLYLHSVNIAEYPPAGPTGSAAQHTPTRVRTLLAHKREIVKLARQVEAKGMTLVPLKIYFKEGKAKLLIGLARGRAHHDKREAIAKREMGRDMERAMSRRG